MYECCKEFSVFYLEKRLRITAKLKPKKKQLIEVGTKWKFIEYCKNGETVYLALPDLTEMINISERCFEESFKCIN